MLAKKQGFTLLEILIALFVFTIISLIVSGALHTVFTSQSNTEKRAKQLSELQIALLLMSKDVEQTNGRLITTSQNAEQGFIGTQTTLFFTHGGLVNPLAKSLSSTLQRTSYQLEKDNLVRIVWPALDQTDHTIPIKKIILHNVTAMQFAYLDKQKRFSHKWPYDERAKSLLPAAVSVSLTLKNWGKITQLYLIPGQNLDE